MWAELRTFIPRGHCTHNAHNETDDSDDESMCHWVARCETRGDEAAENIEHGAICGCKSEKPVRHWLSPRRKNTGGVEDGIGSEGENSAGEESGSDGTNAERKIGLLVHDAFASVLRLSDGVAIRVTLFM